MVTRGAFLTLALCCGLSMAGLHRFPLMGKGMVPQGPMAGQESFPTQYDIGQPQIPSKLDIGQAQFQQQIDFGQVPIFAGKRPLEMPAQFQKQMDIRQMPIFAGKRPLEMPARFQKHIDISQVPIFAGKRPLEMPVPEIPPPTLYPEVHRMPWLQFAGEMQTKFPHYQNFLPHPQSAMPGMGLPFMGNLADPFSNIRNHWQHGFNTRLGVPSMDGNQWMGDNAGQWNAGQWNGGLWSGGQLNGENRQGANQNGLGVFDNQGVWKQLPVDNPLAHVMSPNAVAPFNNNNMNNAGFGPGVGQQMESKRSGFDDINGLSMVPLQGRREGFVTPASQPGTVQFVDNTKKGAKKDDKAVPTNVDVVHAPLVQEGFSGYPSRPLKK